MKIYAQIPLIMAEVEAIAKTRKNAQQGFQYRGIDDIYAELQLRLAKHKVFTSPEVLEFKREERPTKSGGLMTYTVAKIRYRFYAEDGSFFDSVVIGEGSDSGDKSSNKSMAIAHKYALTQVFCIPTSDAKDPDAESHEVAQRSHKTASPWKPGKAEHDAILAMCAQHKVDPKEVSHRLSQAFGASKLSDLNEDQYFQLQEWLILEGEKRSTK